MIGSIHAYQMIQFVTDHLGNADGYTAETRLRGRSGLAGRKHFPAKQFFCFSQPVGFVPCNIQPENMGLNPYKRAIFLYLRTIKYFLAHDWHKNYGLWAAAKSRSTFANTFQSREMSKPTRSPDRRAK
jgi:hypothetical protein